VADVLHAENYELFTSPGHGGHGGLTILQQLQQQQEAEQKRHSRPQQQTQQKPQNLEIQHWQGSSTDEPLVQLSSPKELGHGADKRVQLRLRQRSPTVNYVDPSNDEIDDEFDDKSDDEVEQSKASRLGRPPRLSNHSKLTGKQRAQTVQPGRGKSTRHQLGEEVQVLYVADGQWYDAVISCRRKADGAYGVYFPESREWGEWAEWVSVDDAATRLRKPVPKLDSERARKRKFTLTLNLVHDSGVADCGKIAARCLPPKMRHKRMKAEAAKSAGGDSPKTPVTPVGTMELAAVKRGPGRPRKNSSGHAPGGTSRSVNKKGTGPTVKRGPGRPRKNAAVPSDSPRASPRPSPRPSPKPVAKPAAAALGELPAHHAAIVSDLEAMGFDKVQSTDAAKATAFSSTMAAVEYLTGGARRRKRTRS